jgi:tRNA-dihydrouridine synthase 2
MCQLSSSLFFLSQDSADRFLAGPATALPITHVSMLIVLFIMNTQILRHLIENVPVPVSCKIRLLPDEDETLALVDSILETGISCLTVHCRTPTMRPRETALLERLRAVVDRVNGRVPVVANGDCWGAQDVDKIKALTGVQSIMIARGAEANPSCFRPQGPLGPVQVVLPRYIRLVSSTPPRIL